MTQCVSTIDLHVTHDADVSRRTSVATCKNELLITGHSKNKCASLITYHERVLGEQNILQITMCKTVFS